MDTPVLKFKYTMLQHIESAIGKTVVSTASKNQMNFYFFDDMSVLIVDGNNRIPVKEYVEYCIPDLVEMGLVDPAEKERYDNAWKEYNAWSRHNHIVMRIDRMILDYQSNVYDCLKGKPPKTKADLHVYEAIIEYGNLLKDRYDIFIKNAKATIDACNLP